MWQNIGLTALVTSVIVLLGSFFIKDNLPDRPQPGYVRNQKSYSAVVYGSSGAVGRATVSELAKSELCKRVGAVVRGKKKGTDEIKNDKKQDNQSDDDEQQKNILFAEGLTKTQLQKISLIHVDYDKLSESQKSLSQFDHAVCALGTTIRTAGSSEKFRRVDLEYVVSSARVSHVNGVQHFSLVTSMGTNINSSMLYPQTKGEAEEECKKIGFPNLSIFRPGLLLTPRNESRPFELIAQVMFPHFHWLLNLIGLGKYKAVHVDRVALAMRWNIEKQERTDKVEVFENGEILQLDISPKV